MVQWTNCCGKEKAFGRIRLVEPERRGDERVRCLSDRRWAVQARLSDLGAASLSRALFQVSIRGLLQEGNLPSVDGAGRRELQDEKIKRAMQDYVNWRLMANCRSARLDPPYGWLLDPEGISKVVLDFLEGNKS